MPEILNKKEKKLRFPKGEDTLHIPSVMPFGWKSKSMEIIAKTMQKFGSPARKVDVRFTFEILLSDQGPGYEMTQVSFIRRK